ncbi:MAG: TIGR01212 family radical SAM protein [Filifactoraceae bacterium]
MLYYSYGQYNKDRYGEKVYKLPVNLPLTCPNRDGKISTGGCTFCADVGTGFESLNNTLSVSEQLRRNMEYIGEKYKAKKFIAYFQNYTNTYMSIEKFENYMNEAASEDIIGITVSTRPDCISRPYLEYLKNLESKGLEIVIELGLQSVNNETLIKINRGHNVEDFIKAVELINEYGFKIIVHMILNLPYDSEKDVIDGAKLLSRLKIHGVKLHSLYIPKNSLMGKEYRDGLLDLGTVEDYVKRSSEFLTYLNKDMVIYRLVGRAPEKDSLFCNYGYSWWKIKDMIEEYMMENDFLQGSRL